VKTGFSLMEVLVAVAIVAILAALLVPVASRALENSRRAACIANLSNISSALNLYAVDNQGRLPPHNGGGPASNPVSWAGAVEAYSQASPSGKSGMADIRCKTGKAAGAASTYNFNTRWYTSSSNWPYDLPKPNAAIIRPSHCIVVYCNWWSAWPTGGKAIGDPNTHDVGRNVLYADGHVESRDDYAIHGRISGSFEGVQYVNGIPVDDLKSN
jgi:prepilin-type N-terminal cleavage/methylation domain-containing protein/prepilin-type processing-associated H-X9-DG protein